MRTAEEIFDDYVGDTPPHYEIEKYQVLEIINNSRKQAIEECAEKATVKGVEFWKDGYPIVNKASILSLIDELK